MKAWNEWRSANAYVRPDLRDADLGGANLAAANLAGANLSRADLVGADLSKANLSKASLHAARLLEANLNAADLSAAILFRARLAGTNLRRANLSGAFLIGANLALADLRAADLGAADLRGAWIGGTVFSDNDLSTTKDLDFVRHFYPSTVGIDTIYKSQGKIPLAFLRGCGVTEDFITFMPSLLAAAAGAIQFYSCFISYSTKDQEFANRLYADLQNKGVRCWYAPHDIQGGKFLDEQIDAAIRLHEKVLLILSPNSIHSDWVQVEVGRAREREAKEGKRVLFPVRLVEHEEVLEALRDWALYHGKEGKDAAGEIRRFYIPDFSRWKEHDLYKKEFDKLLRDLKVEEA